MVARQARARGPRPEPLLEIVGGIENVHRLEAGLEQSIGPRGDVLDTASAELSRLRKAVRIAHSRVTERLRNLQSSGRVGAAMQENIITVREGRYVIPIRIEARNVVRALSMAPLPRDRRCSSTIRCRRAQQHWARAAARRGG